MSCKKLKAPQPPTLESLPKNVKMPEGLSVDSIKSMASGKGLSDMMSNVGGMISSNLNSLSDHLSPTALAGKVSSVVDSIAGGIESRVNMAINSVTSIKGMIGGAFSQADKIKDRLTGKVPGRSEFAELQSSISNTKCDGKYTSQAGAVVSDINSNINSQSSRISKKDKRNINKNQSAKDAKAAEIQENVSVKTADKAATQNKSKEDRSEQETLVETELTVTEVENNLVRPELMMIDTRKIGPRGGWGYDENGPELLDVISSIRDAIDSYKPGEGRPDIVDIQKQQTSNERVLNGWIEDDHPGDSFAVANKAVLFTRPSNELVEQFEEYLEANRDDWTNERPFHISRYMLNITTYTTKWERDQERETTKWLIDQPVKDEDGNVIGKQTKQVPTTGIFDIVHVAGFWSLIYTVQDGDTIGYNALFGSGHVEMKYKSLGEMLSPDDYNKFRNKDRDAWTGATQIMLGNSLIGSYKGKLKQFTIMDDIKEAVIRGDTIG